MGTEWCTIVTLVDLKGYVVAKVSGLGKLEADLFYQLFNEYIENPQYICTDKNSIYSKYCKAKGYELYVCPSKYLEITKKAGCIYPPKNDLEREENFKICKYF